MVLDVRTSYPQQGGVPYVPENYDRQFHGPGQFKIALARSYNIPAVEMMNRVGVDNVIRTAHRMGINTLDRGHRITDSRSRSAAVRCHCLIWHTPTA